MADEFACPQCLTTLSERMLLRSTRITEACPKCRHVINNWQGAADEAAIYNDDLEEINEWLEKIAADGRVTVSGGLGQFDKGKGLWFIENATPLGTCEILYFATWPRTLRFSLQQDAPSNDAVDKNIDRMRDVCADHGVESVGITGTNRRWGACQHLSTRGLHSGCFWPIVRRLDVVMKDLTANLST